MMAGEDAPVVIPVYRGRKGHPVLINASLAGQIASYRGDRGLKGAIDAAGVPVSFVAVEDGGVLLRAREEDRFEEVAGREKPVPVHPRVKVQLVRNVPFFGPGLMNLLRQIEVLGNVREACEKTGMSYSKGWSTDPHGGEGTGVCDRGAEPRRKAWRKRQSKFPGAHADGTV